MHGCQFSHICSSAVTSVNSGNPNSHPQLGSSPHRRSKETSESAQICRMSLCKHAHSVRWVVCLGSRRPWRCSLITMLRFWCHSRNGNAGLILIDILFCPHQLDWSSEQEEVTLSHQKTGRLQEHEQLVQQCGSFVCFNCF